MTVRLNAPNPIPSAPATAGAPPVAAAADPAALLRQQAATAAQPFDQLLIRLAGLTPFTEPTDTDADTGTSAAATDDPAQASAADSAVQPQPPVSDAPLLAAMLMPIAMAMHNTAPVAQMAQMDSAGAPGESSAGARTTNRIDTAAPLQPLPPASAAAPMSAMLHTPAQRAAAPAVEALQPAIPGKAGAPIASADPAAQQDPTQFTPAPAGAAQAMQVPAAGAPVATPDTVALAGPPAAWRQNLHEALGERLHLQLGNNLDHAVIRLDPPNMGRIEIAIRHAAGSLEVTLSATHGDVLRELRTVSESLRNDLAQRQYTEVAVTVTPAPRSASANPFAGEHQGRGHQGGSEQEERAPGLALAEADASSSGFSLTARE